MKWGKPVKSCSTIVFLAVVVLASPMILANAEEQVPIRQATDQEVDRAIKACTFSFRQEQSVEVGLDVLKKRIVSGEGGVSSSSAPALIPQLSTNDALQAFLKTQDCIRGYLTPPPALKTPEQKQDRSDPSSLTPAISATFLASSHGYDIQGHCRRLGGSVMCPLTITNQDETRETFMSARFTMIYDKKSRAYEADEVGLAGTQPSRFTRARLLKGLPAEGRLQFDTVPPEVSEIYRLEIGMGAENSPNFTVEISQAIPIIGLTDARSVLQGFKVLVLDTPKGPVKIELGTATDGQLGGRAWYGQTDCGGFLGGAASGNEMRFAAGRCSGHFVLQDNGEFRGMITTPFGRDQVDFKP